MYRKDRSGKSLCERSMKMVTNIIRFSSFSLARASLGTSASGRPHSSKTLPISSSSGDDSSCMVSSQSLILSGSRRSTQETSKTVSYLVEPEPDSGEKGLGSSYVVHRENNVDGLASDYIDKVHRKNRHHLRETPEDFRVILPPPPRIVK